MRNARLLKYSVCSVALIVLSSCLPLYAQADIESTVRNFLQAWYVDKKNPDELSKFIAKDNAFEFAPMESSSSSKSAALVDPWKQVFAGAFAKVPIGARFEAPRSLSDAIEFPPSKNGTAMRTMSREHAIMSGEFAIFKPDALPKGSVLPVSKPSGSDPVAKFLYHLSEAYKDKLYIVVYATKGAGLLRETSVLYWIQEDNSWKLAAFMGTNW